MLASKTVKIRHKIAYTCMEILAPKLKTDLLHAYNAVCNDTPRPFTKMLKQTFSDIPLKGCEIGFGYGANAQSILTELNIEKLYCLDPYFGSKPYIDTGVTVDWFSKPTPQDEQRMQTIFEMPNVEFVMADSDHAFTYGLLPKNLDFIYIDGNHTRDFCYRDIANSMSYVKQGGFVGGHDFANGSLTGVGQAVFQYSHFAKQIPDVVFPDFWFKKEK